MNLFVGLLIHSFDQGNYSKLCLLNYGQFYLNSLKKKNPTEDDSSGKSHITFGPIA